jgi:hypothetical protein
MQKLRFELLRSHEPTGWVRASHEQIQSVHDWAGHLLGLLDQHDPLNRILAFDEDILGTYHYQFQQRDMDEYRVNRAWIKLYWGVVGLTSEWMGCSPEDLTLVVLTHELAHAYTQLGADIEGRRWPAAAFSVAETGLKEGLAQYYTDRVLKRLGNRFPNAYKVYQKMLPKQPQAYRSHIKWVTDYSPESVRRAMLEVRRWQHGTLSEFNQRLEEARKQLEPEHEHIG